MPEENLLDTFDDESDELDAPILRLLDMKILQVLQRHSDAKHPLTQQKIIEYLAKDFNGEICDRRSVSKNIRSLKDAGINIISSKKGSWLVRDFDESELRMLIDSVLFSKNIPTDKVQSLIDKLKNLANEYFSAKVKHIINLPRLQHSDNAQVMTSLDILNDAIHAKKKVTFVYNKYGKDLKLQPRRTAPYKVSPYQMAATNGNYYLIANTDGYNNISHYRIDRMTEVKMLNESARDNRDQKNKIEGCVGGLNLPEHMAQNIYMFGGKSIWVKFWTREFMIDTIVDWFGKNFKILQSTDEKILVEVKVNENAIKYWLMQYGENVEVVKPDSLRREIHDMAEKIMQAHS